MTAAFWLPATGCDAYCFWVIVVAALAALSVIGYLIYRESNRY